MHNHEHANHQTYQRNIVTGEQHMVIHGLRQLTPWQRTLLVLMYHQGLHAAEMAELLGYPVSVVNIDLLRAKRQFRRHVAL